MKLFVVLLFALVAVAASQRRRIVYPRLRYLPAYGEDVYAASLGGAPVGLYSRTGGRGGLGRHGFGSDVYGASLGGAKVGMYSREGSDGYGRGGSDVYGASLGGEKVGMYSREHHPRYRLPLLG